MVVCYTNSTLSKDSLLARGFLLPRKELLALCKFNRVWRGKMRYTNKTGQDIRLVTNKDGEYLPLCIPDGYSIEALSPAQILRRKMYKQKTYKVVQGEFCKMYIRTRELADKFKDYPEAFISINYLIDYIEPESNILIKNKRSWIKDDLAKDMGVSRQTAYRYIDKMVEVHLIKQITILGKGKVWVVNPYYFQNGGETITEIVTAFPKPPKAKKDENKQ
jgi:hypothetical protein